MEKLATNENDEASPAKAPRLSGTGFFADFMGEIAIDQAATTLGTATTLDEEDCSDMYMHQARKMVSSYLTEQVADNNSNPLDYWRLNENEYPALAKLAKKYLSSSLGTAISEREFKVVSDITKDDRIRLLPENAEKLLFLMYNLRAIGYKSFALSGENAKREQMTTI